MNLLDHGDQKYTIGDVLDSSAKSTWTGIAADIRMHPACELPSIKLEQMEIGIALRCHRDSVVHRTGDGMRQVTKVQPGMIWLCPTGAFEEDIRVTAWHEVLHIYLPPSRFGELSDIIGGAQIRADAIRYLGGLFDDRVRDIGKILVSEMRSPSAASDLVAGSLGVELVRWLVHKYSGAWSRSGEPGMTKARLEERRLRRVIDFMIANIDQSLSIDDLASVACLSAFHFIRMFKHATGKAPARYLNELRLERAKTLLALGDAPLVDIALSACFSSQSNFTRAFHREVGVTPHQYRAAVRS